ncbi:MAG: hypothetical protein K2L11_00180 [Muribaculaceae bacterium]|nr:hypothetical protein [Muribaculaceae bacterium]
MRNIKSTLRFARNSALLLVAASGMSYLTACQSEQLVDDPNNNVIPESPKTSVPYSVYGANQGRVTNYGKGSTRAGEYVEAAKSFDMPEAVAVPEGIATTTGVGTNDGWKISEGVDYLIPEGEVFDAACKLTANYYVAGTWNVVNGFWGVTEGATIYVLPGGTLNVGSTLQPGLTIYNYGTLKSDNPIGICIADGVTLYSAVDITECEVFGVNDQGKIYSRGTIQADKEVRLNGEAIACAFIADKIDIHSVGTIKTSYFEADDLTLNSGNVVLDNNGLVKAKKLNISNNETRFTINGTNAVVAAEEFNTNWISWPKEIFAANIAMDLGKCYVGGTETPYSDFEWQVSAENQVKWVPAAGCHGEYGKKPENNPGGDEDPGDGDDEPTVEVPEVPTEPIITPELVKIVDIEGLDDEINHGDHDHGIISATCINFGADGTAYASYHLRGAGKGDHNQPNYVGEYAQKGCIEVIKDNGEAGMELGSYMIAPDWDFNHLIVDGNRIVTVGNAKKLGAFVGTLPVDFAASSNTDRDDFEVKELTTAEAIYGISDKTGEEIKIGYKNAGDGNCVVRQGNYYYVATYEGYGPINLDFSRVKNEAGDVVFKKTNGSAKHISINGGNMAVIALDSYDKTRSTASVYTFGASDYSFANVLASYDAIGTVEPVDGKNVIAVDGNDIYACLSKGGLVRVNDGKKFQRGTNGNVPVNGMAFDEKYIYVANGSFVSVLDKETMNEICYYHASSLKSANYIALRNGKIYVAFGEDGIQVFQLVEKEIAQQ